MGDNVFMASCVGYKYARCELEDFRHCHLFFIDSNSLEYARSQTYSSPLFRDFSRPTLASASVTEFILSAIHLRSGINATPLDISLTTPYHYPVLINAASDDAERIMALCNTHIIGQHRQREYHTRTIFFEFVGVEHLGSYSIFSISGKADDVGRRG